MSLKLGLYLGYWGIGPAGDEALEAVLAAEEAGFESVWVAESYGSDCVSVLAWLAGQTELPEHEKDDTDAGALKQRMITITPIQLQNRSKLNIVWLFFDFQLSGFFAA